VSPRGWPAALLLAGVLALTGLTACADRRETTRSTSPGTASATPATASVPHGPAAPAVVDPAAADAAAVEAAVEAADRALARAEEAMAGDD